MSGLLQCKCSYSHRKTLEFAAAHVQFHATYDKGSVQTELHRMIYCWPNLSALGS